MDISQKYWKSIEDQTRFSTKMYQYISIVNVVKTFYFDGNENTTCITFQGMNNNMITLSLKDFVMQYVSCTQEEHDEKKLNFVMVKYIDDNPGWDDPKMKKALDAV
jgi:hypothetical protein